MKPSLLQMGEFPEWDQLPLEEAFTVFKYFEAENGSEFLRENGAKIRGIATGGHIGASREIIDACPNLELIAVYGVGFDAVDIEVCKARGIKVTNTPDVLTGDVADLAIGLALALTRKMVDADLWVRSGHWQAGEKFPLQERFYGRRAGILGMGRIGLALAKRLQGFDMEIFYHNRRPIDDVDFRYVGSPSELAAQCDFLFVALAASENTRKIVDKDVLAKLGAKGYLINISRGQNVDEEALIAALDARKIAGAALDVFENEPDINPRFLEFENVLLQPHIGSATVETRKAMGALMRQNLEAYFSGAALLTPVV